MSDSSILKDLEFYHFYPPQKMIAFFLKRRVLWFMSRVLFLPDDGFGRNS